MPTEPKCDVCGTFCGLWLTSDGWRCPVCMWAEVVELRGKVKQFHNVISGIQGGERPGDTLIRLAPLIRSVKLTSDQPDTTTADWREWLLDFGARLNEVSGEKKRWDFKKSVQRANGSG